MCRIQTDCKSGYPSEVRIIDLKPAIGVMSLPHQQATVRAQSLRTILPGIKSDLNIYKVQHFKHLGMFNLWKCHNTAMGAACYCDQDTGNIDVILSFTLIQQCVTLGLSVYLLPPSENENSMSSYLSLKCFEASPGKVRVIITSQETMVCICGQVQ